MVACLLSAICLGLGAEPTFHPAPRLATTPAELAQIKARADFAQRRDQAVRGAEAILQKGVAVPAGWGNWSFYYACPDDGSPLRAQNDAAHECPRCKKVHKDERTVASYRTLQHDRVNDAALQLAWAHAYTGEPRYAAEVRRILLKLADDYKTYPQRRDRWGREGIFALLGGRRYSQSLDEAVGVIKLAKAYDLTRAAGVWSDDDRTHVERGFFKPTADTLLVANWDINNHQTWYNAGLMAIASVLEDKALVHKVLTMRGGFHDQLKRSLGRDGVWYEGTVAYHNYALQAMIEIVDAGRRMGLPLHQEPAFRRLLEAPLAMTYPNGQFPAMNDSDQGHIASFAGAFRWAWETYREERFAQALARGDAKALQALLGPEARSKPYLDTQSRVLEDIGLAILRRGEGADAACVMMDYGPHGGSHGHFDKLNIVVYAAGQEWLLDPGRLTYSHKEYKTWVKHTAAHNTVTLGGRSQSATTGKLLWFKSTEAYAACAAESTEAYAGATLRRSLLLMDGMLVDVFDVAAPQATQIDWFAHALGKTVEPGADLGASEAATLGNEDGYAHLTAARAWTSGPSSWDFVTGPKRLRVWLAGLPREQLITCLGIGYTIDQKVPCLVRRVRAREARFAAAYDLTGAATHITTFTAEPDGALTLATRRGTMRFRFTREGVVFDTSR